MTRPALSAALLSLVLACAACGPGGIAGSTPQAKIERGTALPPPDLAAAR